MRALPAISIPRPSLRIRIFWGGMERIGRQLSFEEKAT
jgi:hypothetical protein